MCARGARVPQLIGKPLVNSPLLERAALAEHGNYQVNAAVTTGRPAIVSYRRLADYPLVVSVGYGSDEVFAPYRDHRVHYIVAGLGLSALVVFISILLAIHRRRLAGWQNSVDRHAGEHEPGHHHGRPGPSCRCDQPPRR